MATAANLDLTSRSYMDAHGALVQLVEAGVLTAVDLFDSLPWTRSGADWTAWRAFLCAAYGVPMTDAEYEIYKECTGRTDRPSERAREAYLPTGRRARKSAIVAVMAVDAAAFHDHSSYLAPGERAVVPIMAKNKADARTIKRYCEAILSGPLRELLEKEPTEETISLRTRCDIEIKAARVTGGRSFTCPFYALDEVAFFPTDESASPDVEILRGLRPSQVMVPGAMGVCLSSPYARRGVLFDAYQQHYGKPGRVLVWKAPTLTMHRTPQIEAEVMEAYRTDPVAAAAEYGAEFRADVQAYVPEEVVRACSVTDRTVLPPSPKWRYLAFVDPSGGTSDSFTLSIGHYDPDLGKAVQDLSREWTAPFKPHHVVQEACDELRRYGIRMVTGDRYAGEWPASRFAEGAHNLTCDRRRDEDAACSCKDVWKVGYAPSEETKSDLYRETLPAMRDGRVDLLDIPRQATQFVGLDRRVARGGHESIDHRPGDHDDVANAAAGMIVRILRERPRPHVIEQPTTIEEAHNARLLSVKKEALRRTLGKDTKYRGGHGAPGI